MFILQHNLIESAIYTKSQYIYIYWFLLYNCRKSHIFSEPYFLTLLFLFISVQSSLSVMSDSSQPMDHSTPGFPVHHQLQIMLKLRSIESMIPSNHLILCHPLLFLPSISPSIRVFPNDSLLCIRWSKFWSFSLSICLSNEYSGLISFRVDCLDFLGVQGTLKSLLQHNSKASILDAQLSL